MLYKVSISTVGALPTEQVENLIWGISSVGRAPALHAGGQEFEPPILQNLIEEPKGSFLMHFLQIYTFVTLKFMNISHQTGFCYNPRVYNRRAQGNEEEFIYYFYSHRMFFGF